MRHIYIAFIGLLLTWTAVAKGYEAEFKQITKSWTLHADGGQEYRHSKELTIYTHTAMNSTYGESFITYNPNHQKIVIHSAYTKQKDGNIIQTPENAFVEVLPRNAAKAPDYNHLKELVIVHTGLDLGSTIYLDYSIITEPGYLKEIDICQSLNELSPVKDYRLRISLPEGKPLESQIINSSLKPKTSTSQGIKTHSYQLNNLAPRSFEPGTTVLSGGVQQLIATSYKSTSDALATLESQFGRTRDLRVNQLANQLTATHDTNREKAYALLDYVVNQVETTPLTLEDVGFRIRPEVSLITNGYGTEAEKAALLYGLLKAGGLDAEIWAYYLKPISVQSGLTAIDKLIVAISLDGEEYLLSPTSLMPVHYTGAYALNMQDGETKQISTGLSRIAYSADIKLTEGKANEQIKASFSSGFIPFSANVLSVLTGGAKEATSKQEKGQTTVDYSQGSTLQSNDGYTLYRLPDTSLGITQQGYQKYNSTRQGNLVLSAPISEQYSYSVKWDDNLELRTADFTKEIKNKVGVLLVSFHTEGDKIIIQRSIEINQPIITPTMYADFKQLITAWVSDQNKHLLFKEK